MLLDQRSDSPATARLKVEHPSEGVLALWLDRPERRNAIDGRMVAELTEALRFGPVRAVVLGSSDPKAFCAGADLDLADAERAKVSDQLYELYERMIRFPAPIIAALEGPAVGGGAQLAIASDMRIASESASLRFVGPGHGLAVGAWGLPALAGRSRAIDLCLTMRKVDAREALTAGIVDRIEPDPKQAAIEIAERIAQLDAGAVRRVKHVAHRATGTFSSLAEERRGNRAAWSGSTAGRIPPERSPR